MKEKKLEIISLKGNFNNPQKIARAMIKNLQDKNLYHPKLMYRGVFINEDKLNKIKKYGTDRNPKDVKRKINEEFEQDCINKISMSEEEYSDYLENNWKLEIHPERHYLKEDLLSSEKFSPEIIWALPEKGLSKCISNYSFSENEENQIPMILVYKPVFLRRSFEGAEGDGKSPLKISQEGLLDESLAIYRFKKGTKAIDAYVAGFKIIT
jgi:hypothetical protein|tara:strand:- start:1127 stop:1756 length:630 start_codon:yes stop_codon:yes gene_type:complete